VARKILFDVDEVIVVDAVPLPPYKSPPTVTAIPIATLYPFVVPVETLLPSVFVTEF